MSGRLATGFRKFFGAAEQKAAPTQQPATLAAPDDFLFQLFGVVPSEAGVVVSPESAMHCTAVRCAVQCIAEAIGQLPVHVYNIAADGSRTRDRADPIAAKLNGAANDWTSGSSLREQITRDALLWSQGGFAYINRVGGRVIEITRLHPASVSTEYDQNTGEPTYRLAGEIVPRTDLLHIHGPIVGLLPQSPVTQAKDAIALALVMEGHASRLFGNGARPSGILTTEASLGPDARKNLKTAWQAANGGRNSGGTAVLDNGLSWQSMTITSVDAQFLELRKFATEEIARAFRVSPVLLQDLGRATWSNVEELGRQFVSYTLMPWVKQWQGEILLKLIDPEDRATTAAEFDVDALQQADLAQRATAYSQLVAARVMNPNEIRAREGLPPYEGGDEYLNPNTTTETVTV